jgi:flagella basal body P-ring formation protein FlgA
MRGPRSLLIAFALAATVALVPPSRAGATTAPIDELVAERALDELGAQVPPNATIEVRLAEGGVAEGAFIKEFWIDPKSGQFIANVVSERGLVDRVWGMAMVTVEIPVPNRRLLPDEIVTEADLSMLSLPLQRVGTLSIHDPAALVGQQVRRVLALGRPVPVSSIAPPRIIDRGEKVKIRLRQGALELTAEGRALSDAHQGQELRVVNLSSNKALSAVAVAEGLVSVTGAGF